MGILRDAFFPDRIDSNDWSETRRKRERWISIWVAIAAACVVGPLAVIGRQQDAVTLNAAVLLVVFMVLLLGFMIPGRWLVSLLVQRRWPL